MTLSIKTTIKVLLYGPDVHDRNILINKFLKHDKKFEYYSRFSVVFKDNNEDEYVLEVVSNDNSQSDINDDEFDAGIILVSAYNYLRPVQNDLIMLFKNKYPGKYNTTIVCGGYISSEIDRLKDSFIEIIQSINKDAKNLRIFRVIAHEILKIKESEMRKLEKKESISSHIDTSTKEPEIEEPISSHIDTSTKENNFPFTGIEDGIKTLMKIYENHSDNHLFRLHIIRAMDSLILESKKKWLENLAIDIGLSDEHRNNIIDSMVTKL